MFVVWVWDFFFFPILRNFTLPCNWYFPQFPQSLLLLLFFFFPPKEHYLNLEVSSCVRNGAGGGKAFSLNLQVFLLCIWVRLSSFSVEGGWGCSHMKSCFQLYWCAVPPRVECLRWFLFTWWRKQYGYGLWIIPSEYVTFVHLIVN